MAKYAKNKYDTPIVMCCASCKFKEFKDEKYRTCKLGYSRTKPNYICAAWEMADNLDSAGRGGGGIKKREYLQFVINNLNKGSLEEIQREFEKEHGSIWAVKP